MSEIITPSADYLLLHAGVVSPPVNLEIVARTMGVPIVVGQPPAIRVQGQFLGQYQGGRIRVSERLGGERRRSIIAHELGHAALAVDADDLRPVETSEFARPWNARGRRQQEAEEQRAERFARELLIPELWIREDIRNGWRDFNELVSRYFVEGWMMALRLRELNLTWAVQRSA